MINDQLKIIYISGALYYNSCEEGLPNCDPNAMCIDLNVGSECIYVILAYLIADVDECELGVDNCLPNATCINTIGSFECVCPLGFTGDRMTSCDGILTGHH